MVSKPLMYDLCCCEGGVAYAALQLGWRVIGVDNAPQPRYLGEFLLADALHPPLKPIADLVWCSPDCQGYSRLCNLEPEIARPRIVNEIREVAKSLGRHYVIENVNTCHDLIDPIQLRGQMFGLPLRRYRLFETSFLVPQPKRLASHEPFYQVAGHARGSVGEWRAAMGLPDLTRDGLRQAVPYAYTWYILEYYKWRIDNEATHGRP